MTPVKQPALSVVAVTPEGFSLIRKTLQALHAQGDPSRIELIIVAQAPDQLRPDPALVAGYWGVQIVPASAPWLWARVAGVRCAHAPVVGFLEEHSLVQPGWAEAMEAAHAGPWAAVGPATINANPASNTSVAAIFLDFGQSLTPMQAGPAPTVMLHNSTYKRDILLEFGPALDDLLMHEDLLLADLRARGYQLYQEPAAQVRHFNISRLPCLLRAKFASGRIFGAARASHYRWPLARRALYGLIGPFAGLARVRYVLRHAARTGRMREFLPRALLPTLATLFVHGVGESLGVLFGEGHSLQYYVDVEFRRWMFLAAQDQPAARPAGPPDRPDGRPQRYEDAPQSAQP